MFCTNVNRLFLNIILVFPLFPPFLTSCFSVMETKSCAICIKMRGYKKVSKPKNEIFLHIYSKLLGFFQDYSKRFVLFLYIPIGLIHRRGKKASVGAGFRTVCFST